MSKWLGFASHTEPVLSASSILTWVRTRSLGVVELAYDASIDGRVLQHVEGGQHGRSLDGTLAGLSQYRAHRSPHQQRARCEDALGDLAQIHHTDGRDPGFLDYSRDQTNGPVAGGSSRRQQHGIDLSLPQAFRQLRPVDRFEFSRQRHVSHQ
jgi:hypothetical protein